MERSSDHNDLATALAEVRPAPRDAFAEELDERVAAGFPRRSRLDNSPFTGLAAWVRTLSPPRLLFAGGTAALVAIAIATVVVARGGPSSQRTQIALDRPISTQADGVDQPTHAKAGGVQYSEAIPQVRHSSASSAAGENSASGAPESAEAQLGSPTYDRAPSRPPGLERLSRRHREIERSAVIGLLAKPDDVAADSAEVFAAVHDANGIVLHSTTSSGGNASARFALLIPSARLGDALAALSSIDEVGFRHEATDDITAPIVSTREELQDSRARIDTLLAQLAAAETQTEAEAVEAELRGERRHSARLRGQLANLDRRTTYSRVSVRIASDPAADSGGAWGFDDAIGDAGRILAIAAAVTLVGLAIAAPIALIAVLAWLAHRLWLRTRRERALDA
jgi:hypothetical protein